MSAISGTNSLTIDAVTIPPPPPTRSVEVKAAKRPAPSSKGPVDVVDLSDQAKKILARAKIEQVVADKLDALRDSRKNALAKPTGSQSSGKLSDGVQSSGDKYGSQLIEIFARAQQAGHGYTVSDDYQFADYVDALRDANTRPDGTIQDFHVVLKDVLTPLTPEQVEVDYKLQKEWAQANPEYIAWAKDNTPEWYAIQQAYLNGEVTYLNAKDIPDLNFHNTVVIDNTALGTSFGPTSFSYNHDSAIFKDPTTGYIVGSNGNVIAWKKPVSDSAPPLGSAPH